MRRSARVVCFFCCTMSDVSPEEHSHNITAYLAIIGVIAIVVGVVYVFSTISLLSHAPASQQQEVTLSQMPRSAPVPDANDLTLSQSGFDYLVSYNGTEFFPLKFSAKEGETVRFTNNSAASISIEIASDNAASPSLARGQYWEYTIPATTTMRLIYNADGAAGQIMLK